MIDLYQNTVSSSSFPIGVSWERDNKKENKKRFKIEREQFVDILF